MRKSSNNATPNLNLTRLDSYPIYDQFADLVYRFLPQIQIQMELLDQIETSPNNASLLYKIVQQIQGFHSIYLQSSLKTIDLKAILFQIAKANEIELKDDIILSKKGGLKTEIKQRRMSFAAMKYADADRLLTIDLLREMTDLDVLCSLNGYRLPYYNEKEGRGMYESFFDQYLKEILKITPNNEERKIFLLFQDVIYIVHIFTEFLISLLEVIFEILNLIKTRIKGAELTIDLKLNFKEIQSIQLENLTSCFQDPEKVFLTFRTRKLIRSISDVELGNVSWITKLESYDHALKDSLDLYKMNCNTFTNKINQLKFEHQDDNRIKGLLNDIIIFIAEIKDFISNLENPKTIYTEFFETGKELLKMLDNLEIQHPIKYGLTPRTGRSKIFNLSLSSSDNESPRSDKEGFLRNLKK